MQESDWKIFRKMTEDLRERYLANANVRLARFSKRLLAAILGIAGCCLASHGQETISPIISGQFREDLTTFVSSPFNLDPHVNAGSVDSIYAEARSSLPMIFQFTEDQLATLAAGHRVYSTDVIVGAYADLKVRTKGRPLPHLAEYYYDLATQDRLNPVQAAIYYQYLQRIIRTLRDSNP